MPRVLVPTTTVTPPKATHTTALTGTNNDLVFTAKRGGQWGNNLQVAYLDPGGPSEPLSVTVDGFLITVSLATDGASAITSTANDVLQVLARSQDANALVDVELANANDGTGIVVDFAATSLAGGSYGVVQPAATVGDATNDHYLEGNDGQVELEAVNTAGASATVTVHYGARAFGGGADVEPEVVTIPANSSVVLGPFEPSRFNQNELGHVYFDPSVSTTLEFLARQVSRAT